MNDPIYPYKVTVSRERFSIISDTDDYTDFWYTKAGESFYFDIGVKSSTNNTVIFEYYYLFKNKKDATEFELKFL